MTHRLPDQRRKQPRRAPGAGPNPLGTDGLGPDPHDPRQHQEPPRWTPHGVVAGRASGKVRLPPPGTPPEPPQGRRPGRLPQRGGHPMPHEPVERRRVRHRLQAPSGPQLGGTGQQVLQPPIVLPRILLHPQARQQRRLGEPLGRVLGPIGGKCGRATGCASWANFSRCDGFMATPPFRDPIIAPPILSPQGVFDGAWLPSLSWFVPLPQPMSELEDHASTDLSVPVVEVS